MGLYSGGFIFGMVCDLFGEANGRRFTGILTGFIALQ